MSEQEQTQGNETMNVAEHRAEAPLNERLSREEKEKILLPGPVNEGFCAIQHDLQLAPSIVERKDGALESFDVGLKKAVSKDGGRTWGEFSVMQDIATHNSEDGKIGVLGFGWLRLPSGKIGLGWNVYGTNERGHKINKLHWRLSDDEGKTWSEDYIINETGELGMPSHLEPARVLSSGRIILPVRFCAGGSWDGCSYGMGWWKGEQIAIEGHSHLPEIDITYVYYSDDDGKTWSRSENEVFGWFHKGWNNITACDEPAVEELSDGRLLLMARSTCGRLVRSFSKDGGASWSLVQPTCLASSYSPCVLRRIPGTKDILCVWNQISADECRKGMRRARLSCAITSDGIEWKHFRTLERHGWASEDDRICPDDSLNTCRSLDDVGFLHPDWGSSDYMTVAFHRGEVIFSYPQTKGIGPDIVSAMKMRILPIDWLFASP